MQLTLLDIAVRQAIKLHEHKHSDQIYNELLQLRDQEYQHPEIPNTKLDLIDFLASCSDSFLYGNKDPNHKGQTKSTFVLLANVLSLLAYLPGGVRLFGYHWIKE
jgi:hypothetical protein